MAKYSKEEIEKIILNIKEKFYLTAAEEEKIREYIEEKNNNK